MKITDLEKVSKLQTRLSDCDFHLRFLRGSHLFIKIWNHDKGPILDGYGDRYKYLSEPFVMEMHAGIIREIETRRQEIIVELALLDVSVPASEPTP